MHVLLDEDLPQLLELSQMKGYFTVLIFPSSLETLKYFQAENNKPKTLKQEEQNNILLLEDMLSNFHFKIS